MPTGSFDLDETRPPLWGDALAVGVYRYTPDADNPFEHLPTVRCLQVDWREGPSPPVARIEYITDDTLALNFGWPSQLEELWPIDAQGPYVVQPDDRLVVLARNFDGEGQEKAPTFFFDGFAQIPQADVMPQSSRITF